MRAGRFEGGSFAFGLDLTPVVRKILVVTFGVWILELLLFLLGGYERYATFLDLFALHSNLGDLGERFKVLPKMPWQFVTYMFLHARGPLHILFNMLTLVMFGGAVERHLGAPRFWRFYLVCGVAGGVLTLLPWFQAVTIGASGAVLGVLTAFGLLYPDTPVLLFFVVPVPAKILVLFFAILNLGSAASSMRAAGAGGSDVAFMAHVGGMAAAWFMLRGARFGRLTRPLKEMQRRRVQQEREIEARRRAELLERRDEILEKMHREGKMSLTQEEWRTLLDESKRLRGE